MYFYLHKTLGINYNEVEKVYGEFYACIVFNLL
jgi:hypothetical protein